ncbi:rod shape-determining protein MreC [Elongatibacter sediminis]|uniref:Cell shape-determining protein MreC n=1 Tax=Elongatibacter sediminis TaxID=3119006 RepID=A0AAW9R7B1_9GAMM
MVGGRGGVGANISGQAALTARLMLYSLLAVVLMAMDHRGQYVPKLRGMASYLVEPVYHLVEWPVQALRGAFGFFQTTQTLRGENQRLEEELLRKRAGLQKLASLREENERLRALLDGSQTLRDDYQFAELLSVDLDPFAHKVVIDRGTNAGVTVGQAVIDGHGVMGQVEDSKKHFATVRLISDPNHALPVQINRTGLRTVAFGTGDTGRLRLPSVPREADVREGDLIVTSGLGDRFPGGYPVAEIVRIDRREGQMFAAVEARPLAALDRGREVLLIRTVAESDHEVADKAGSTEAPAGTSDATQSGAEGAVAGQPDSGSAADGSDTNDVVTEPESAEEGAGP